MIKIQKVQHLSIVTNELDKMVRFYSEVLGLAHVGTFEMNSDDMEKLTGIPLAKGKVARLQMPGGSFALELVQFDYPMAYRPPMNSYPNTPGIRRLAFAVEHLETAVDKLKECGALLLSEPVRMSGPGTEDEVRCVYVYDPDGNIVELTQTA